MIGGVIFLLGIKGDGDCALRLVELLLRLLAARALPVIRQGFKRRAVMLGGIVDVSADGADVFAAVLAAEREALRVKALFKKFDSLDLHKYPRFLLFLSLHFTCHSHDFTVL